MEIADLTYEIEQEARQQDLDQKHTRLVEEIWLSWNKMDFSAMHQARVQLAGSGRGPTQRLLFAPMHQQPSLDDWRMHLHYKDEKEDLQPNK